MRAMVIDRHGGSEVIRRAELERPSPGSYGLRVRVVASSVNPADLRARVPAASRAIARTFPLILGYDVAGTVDEVGSRCRGFSVGDEVFGVLDLFGQGAHAEFCVLDGRAAAHKPHTTPFAIAGAAPLVCLTAYNALVERAALRPGERVLIHAGAGGVGHVAIQIARLLGAEVYATAGRERSRALCLELGARAVFDYRDPELVHRLGTELGAAGVDVVLDSVGGSVLAQSAQLVAPLGRIVTLVPGDFAGGGPLPFLRSVSLHYEMMGTRLAFDREPERLGRALSTIADWLEDGRLRIVLAASYPLEELAEAHRRLEAGGFEGKLGIHVST